MGINIQTIMLAANGTASCSAAVAFIGHLARTTSAQIRILHFGDGKPDYAIPNAVIEEISAEPSAKEIINHIGDVAPDLLVLPLLANGSNAGLIAAKEACRVINRYERMVLTFPASTSDLKMDNIVVPLDTSFETRQKTPYALFMAAKFNATLHILGVSNETGKDAEVTVKNYTRQVANHLEEKGCRTTLELRLGGNPTERILDYAVEKKAGLAIIMTEQETGILNLLKGKYSEQMVKSSPIPVLSIHPKDLVVSEARL